MNILRRKRREWIIKQKVKLSLLIILVVVAIFLWTKILLMDDSNQSVTVTKTETSGNISKKTDNQRLEVDQIKSSKRSKLFKFQNTKRKSPFTESDDNKLEFSYNNQVKGDKKSIHRLNSNNSLFTLLGVTKKGKVSLAVVKVEDRVYLLKQGEKLEDFVVEKIDSKEIILLKGNIEYKLDMIKYRI